MPSSTAVPRLGRCLISASNRSCRTWAFPVSGNTAFNDALMTAMMYVQLRDMRQRGARIGRERAVQQEPPIGA